MLFILYHYIRIIERMAEKYSCVIHQKKVYYWTYHKIKKPVIVAIHGFRGTHHGLEFIARHVTKAQIIIPDLPGFGESEPLQKHDLASYSSWLAAFIAQLNLPEPPIILGHSFGSLIVGQALAEKKIIVQKAIFINPISYHNSTIQNTLGQLGASIVYAASRRLPEKVARKILSSALLTDGMSYLLTISREPKIRRHIIDQHRQYFGRYHTSHHVVEAYKTSVAHHLIAYAPHIQTASLLIAGQKDSIVPPHTQIKLHKRLPHSNLHIIDDVGHLIHYEKPHIAAKLIDDFV